MLTSNNTDTRLRLIISMSFVYLIVFTISPIFINEFLYRSFCTFISTKNWKPCNCISVDERNKIAAFLNYIDLKIFVKKSQLLKNLKYNINQSIFLFMLYINTADRSYIAYKQIDWIRLANLPWCIKKTINKIIKNHPVLWWLKNTFCFCCYSKLKEYSMLSVSRYNLESNILCVWLCDSKYFIYVIIFRVFIFKLCFLSIRDKCLVFISYALVLFKTNNFFFKYKQITIIYTFLNFKILWEYWTYISGVYS